jgi:hypothetical protein
MTTPPTPAGWYPDPDGSGGQRYWGGSTWTEHRSPAAHEPTEPTAPTEPPGSEQPTTAVPTRPAGEHVGAHRAAEPEPTPEPAPPPEPEPTPEPVSPPEPEPGPTAVIDLPASLPSAQQTTPIIPPPPPPAEPSYASAPLAPPPSGGPPAPDDRRKLLIWFGSACAALLAVLVLVVIYGVFINKPEIISSGPSSTSKSATPTTSSDNGWGNSTQTASASPTTASGSGPQASDGSLTFAVTGVESAPSVKYQDAPVEKTAQGEFLVVHMTVLNSGDAQGTFLATLQKLKAGGTTYSIDDDATAYLNGTWADLNAGDTADVAIAFDVPPGTTPESLEVHGDPMSAGVDVPLS